MRNYEISNFLCDKTYGGVYAMTDMKKVNKMVVKTAKKTLEKHYGQGRPYKFESDLNLKYTFKRYMFIAWLDGKIKNSSTIEDYHGHHLFVIGFTNSPETCVDDIYEMGDKYFNTDAIGFYY